MHICWYEININHFLILYSYFKISLTNICVSAETCSWLYLKNKKLCLDWAYWICGIQWSANHLKESINWLRKGSYCGVTIASIQCCTRQISTRSCFFAVSRLIPKYLNYCQINNTTTYLTEAIPLRNNNCTIYRVRQKELPDLGGA